MYEHGGCVCIWERMKRGGKRENDKRGHIVRATEDGVGWRWMVQGKEEEKRKKIVNPGGAHRV